MQESAQIKSRERVRDLGEVLTNPKEVKAMLDLLPKESWYISAKKTFLEPACGTGNFLEEILERKLKKILQHFEENLKGWKTTKKAEAEYQLLKMLTTIYGTDICPYNVETSRIRLENIIRGFANNQWGENKVRKTKHKQSCPLSRASEAMLERILEGNIRECDFLNPKGATLSDWKYPQEGYFQQEWHLIANLGTEEPPIRKEALFNFYAARRLER